MSLLNAPAYLLRTLAARLPRLRARETLRWANAVALGTGTLSKPDQRELLRELRRDANAGSRPAPAAVARTAADLERLTAEFGVGLRLVKKTS